MSATKTLRDRPRVDYKLLSGVRMPPTKPTSTPVNVSVSSVDELESLEQTLRELEVEEKVIRLQQKIEEKKRVIEELQTFRPKGNTIDRPGTTTTTSNNGELNLGDIYSSQAISRNQNAMRVDLNPQSYLYSPKMESVSTKYKPIVDYIPKSAKGDAVEEEYELLPDLKLSAGKKAKLDAVTPAQWMAASSCILAELVQESHSSNAVQLTRDYMAHMTKVGVLATHFTWRSVIKWDDEYREKQHVNQFRWGSDSSHLTTVLLVPRDGKDKEKRPSKGDHVMGQKAGPARTTTAPAPVCFNWNKEQPCGRTPCRYRHICEWCNSPSHPRIRHDEAAKLSQHQSA